MAQVVPGRFTAQIDEPFVVFIIGMRINQFFAFSKWIPTARAMPLMLQNLVQNPEKGFLGGKNFIYWRGAALIQYWRSFEDLEKFARNPGDIHQQAWQKFNKSIGNDGSVGIWHETYVVQPKQYEAIYVNMPVFGLAAATEHIPVAGKRARAREQLKQKAIS